MHSDWEEGCFFESNLLCVNNPQQMIHIFAFLVLIPCCVAAGCCFRGSGYDIVGRETLNMSELLGIHVGVVGAGQTGHSSKLNRR